MNFLLMGKTGCGKSATGNTILGHKPFRASSDSTSKTKEVKAGYADVERYRLKVIDGPGLDDTDMDKAKDIETASENMGKALMMCSEGVDAFLYVMPFGNRFTAEEKAALESLKGIFGEKYFNHVIVIITKGDDFEASMEEEERNMTFEEWCREQKGEFRNLYENCNGRFVLFNNREKIEDKKMAQVQKLMEISEKLHAKNGRYNHESFEKAKGERERLILEMKAPQLKEEIQEKIGLLVGETEKYTMRPSAAGKEILQRRIQDLEDEIKQQDKGYGVLDSLLTNVIALRDQFDNTPELQKRASEIKFIDSLLWRILRSDIMIFYRAILSHIIEISLRNKPWR